MMKETRKNKTVFVAMSGGVDSSVAAALLKQKGYKVVGVTMCFDIDTSTSKGTSCCGAEAIAEAKRAAEVLGIPHYVLNFGKELDKDVIENFVDEYLSGRTPNPCTQCNQSIKFGKLLKKVKALGADYLATGHYARVGYNFFKKQYELKKGKDPLKDQAYFLYRIPKDALSSILFPIGNLRKTHVRRLAKKFGLENSERKDSQDVCFIPNSDYKGFIIDRVGKKALSPGPIKNEKGEIVGEHKGVAFYTIGQRDGLGIALGKPVYVYCMDAKANTIFVGDKKRLRGKGLIVHDLNFLSINFPKKKIEARIKIRYNHPEAKGIIEPLGKGRARALFHKPQQAITPGQSVVFYKKDVVLGGGIIQETF